MRTKLITAAVLSLMLGACAELTSPTPLFSVSDQIGPAPLMEGVWVGIDDKCTRADAHRRGRLPRGCEPFEVRRAADGAWRVTGSRRDEDGHDQAMDIRLIVAPATEHPAPDAFAPLYLAEYQNDATSTESNYLVFAPVGELPAREIFISSVGCEPALRDGAIEGIAEQHGDDGKPTACVASTPGAVREAARRAIIQALPSIDETRLVFVRP